MNSVDHVKAEWLEIPGVLEEGLVQVRPGGYVDDEPCVNLTVSGHLEVLVKMSALRDALGHELLQNQPKDDTQIVDGKVISEGRVIGEQG